LNTGIVFQGVIGKSWKDEHKRLPYTREPLSEFDRLLYERSGYQILKDTSYTHEIYSDPILPDYCGNLTSLFGIYDCQIVFHKIGLLDFVPQHVPSNLVYCDKEKVDKENVFHTIMLLEDWQSGQYLEIGDIGITNWKEGDWYKISAGTKISYGNFGTANMYVLFVTGKNTYSGQLNMLLHFNLPNYNDQPASSHPLIQTRIRPIVQSPQNIGSAAMVYMNNGPIEELDSLEHDEEGKTFINEHGIKIWLFEPMCSYTEGEEHTQGYYSEFKYPHDLTLMRSKELDSILGYQQKNNIDNHKITVYTGEYNSENHYPYYAENLNIVCNDLYLAIQNPIVGLEDNLTDEYLTHPFNKKFISLNWRFTKHRQFVANFLAGENGYLSWYFKNNFEDLIDTFWADIESWKETQPNIYAKLQENNKVLEANSPYIVDQFTFNAHYDGTADMWPDVDEYDKGQTPSISNTQDINLYKFYKEAFFDIVTETRFAEPSANFSEKILQPVQYMKPFVVFAPPKTLEYFKSFGYQTFSEFWDESYDDELDHDKRLVKLLELVDSILNKSIEELRTMYQQMRPIVEHNKSTYLELVRHPNYTNTEWYG
jgi:hypothetical protein